VASAEGHLPQQAEIQALGQRARIRLQAQTTAPENPSQADVPATYALTGRELAVLRLLAAGRTNARIGAELYISPKTASVHVTSILRQLGVSGRVQAAALAERAAYSRLAAGKAIHGNLRTCSVRHSTIARPGPGLPPYPGAWCRAHCTCSPSWRATSQGPQG
jgi:DNA-binding CsgD family transcriptional regulator